jgi:GNAT superfamily N-acetyltransferase
MTIIEAYDKEMPGYRTEPFLEYAPSMDFDLSFQAFDREIADLPGDHSVRAVCPPRIRGQCRGGIRCLTRYRRECGGDGATFVRPHLRCVGVGRTLVRQIIEEVLRRGYTRMRLDTLPSVQFAAAPLRTLHNHIARVVTIQSSTRRFWNWICRGAGLSTSANFVSILLS